MTEIVLLKKNIKELKEQQAESLRLLKACVPQVGMVMGEELNTHIAELSGSHFNAKEYHYERPVGEQ